MSDDEFEDYVRDKNELKELRSFKKYVEKNLVDLGCPSGMYGTCEPCVIAKVYPMDKSGLCPFGNKSYYFSK